MVSRRQRRALGFGIAGWLVAFVGKATVLREPPERMWEIVV